MGQTNSAKTQKATIPTSADLKLPGAIGAGLLVIIMGVVRCIALDSDAYGRLSWSAALLTDEGYYIHNARNLVLFGQMRTDGFNNALIMPTLHYLQVAVFSHFGVGAIQARMISVVLSLLTLLIFAIALNRAFGGRVALLGTLFLGLDHVHFLYNRMALMDTPAAFVMVCSFAAWVESVRAERRQEAWLLLCGLLLGLAFATRGLSALLIPVPLLLAWRRAERGPGRWRGSVALGAGLGAALALYIGCWYLPHRGELGQINHYYLTRQLLPSSFGQFAHQMGNALFGDDRGFSPYLFRHTPILFLLALAWIAWRLVAPRRQAADPADANADFLGGWLLAAWVVLAVIGYAPSRYYVLFYPALAGIAALALVQGGAIWETMGSHRGMRAALGGFVVYHLLTTAFHPVRAAGVGGIWALALGAGAALWRIPLPTGRGVKVAGAVALTLWGLINGGWTLDWLTHLTYTQRDADRYLAQRLPPNSVLLGDVAPGLCLNNRFRCVNVIPGLCNDERPIEQFSPAPCYIIILDGRFKEYYWRKNYPQYVVPSRRAALLPRIIRYDVGVYRVNTGA
ncbi:MAG TPA: glycosyltransferase family 39 protein [Chthonomonadaceae bacterium]|nr:glycosyltransferase family 39 protein [Chthonomonadaceae bacterium]